MPCGCCAARPAAADWGGVRSPGSDSCSSSIGVCDGPCVAWLVSGAVWCSKPMPKSSAPPNISSAAADWSTTVAITHSSRTRSLPGPSPAAATRMSGRPPSSKCAEMGVEQPSANCSTALNSLVLKEIRSGAELASAPMENSCRSCGSMLISVRTALSARLSSTSFLMCNSELLMTNIISCSPLGRLLTQSRSRRGSEQMRCAVSVLYIAFTGNASS
mmetsp:Transcript_4986/g.12900  ORF Transcript_4986/g.12900 Transcript_4986/m.12900 type:complete len:217 (-) Transcript_4986:386-1036(-)